MNQKSVRDNVSYFVMVKFTTYMTNKFYIRQVIESLSPISYRIKFMRHKGKEKNI